MIIIIINSLNSIRFMAVFRKVPVQFLSPRNCFENVLKSILVTFYNVQIKINIKFDLIPKNEYWIPLKITLIIKRWQFLLRRIYSIKTVVVACYKLLVHVHNMLGEHCTATYTYINYYILLLTQKLRNVYNKKRYFLYLTSMKWFITPPNKYMLNFNVSF